MSEKMSDINQSVNQLIRHQLFRHHSGKHFFNHYTLNYHTIHSTLQSISSIISTINHSTTRSSNHRGHHTSSIKFGLFRKHLNRIYLNQFNHLHLHRNHLNHLHFRSHQHLNLLQNQFNSISRTPRMTITQDSWHYWIKSIKRKTNSMRQRAISILRCWNFMTNVDARNYSSMRICRVSRSCYQMKHLITFIQICNFAIHFMNFVST